MSKQKTFPAVVHVAYEPDSDGEDDYLCVYTDDISSLEAGQRCAIYKCVDEGVVRGPESFISKKTEGR